VAKRWYPDLRVEILMHPQKAVYSCVVKNWRKSAEKNLSLLLLFDDHQICNTSRELLQSKTVGWNPATGDPRAEANETLETETTVLSDFFKITHFWAYFGYTNIY